jgi:hypothetical protein
LVGILATFGDVSLYDSDGSGNLTDRGSEWTYAFNRKPTTTTAEMISKIGFFHTLEATAEDDAPIAIWRLGGIDFAGIVREVIVISLVQVDFVPCIQHYPPTTPPPSKNKMNKKRLADFYKHHNTVFLSVYKGIEELLRGAFLSHLEEVLQLGRAASSRQKKMVRCRVIIDGTGLGLWMLPYLCKIFFC